MVLGLDLAACDEAAVGAAVDAAWRCFGDGGPHALVNCGSFEGMHILLTDTDTHAQFSI